MVKMGRPPLDDSREKTVRARMSAEELQRLNYCCQVTDKTKSEIIREGIDKVYQALTKTDTKEGGL